MLKRKITHFLMIFNLMIACRAHHQVSETLSPPTTLEVTVSDLSKSLNLANAYQSYELSGCVAETLIGHYNSLTDRIDFKSPQFNEGASCSLAVKGASVIGPADQVTWLSGTPGVIFWAPQMSPLSLGNRGQWTAVAVLAPAFRLTSQKTYEINKLQVSVELPTEDKRAGLMVASLGCEPPLTQTGSLIATKGQTAIYELIITMQDTNRKNGLRCHSVQLFNDSMATYFATFKEPIPLNFEKPGILTMTSTPIKLRSLTMEESTGRTEINIDWGNCDQGKTFDPAAGTCQ